MFGKFNEPTKLYAQACCEVAKEMGSELVDFYTAMSKQEVTEYGPEYEILVLTAYKQKAPLNHLRPEPPKEVLWQTRQPQIKCRIM